MDKPGITDVSRLDDGIRVTYSDGRVVCLSGADLYPLAATPAALIEPTGTSDKTGCA